MKTKQMKPRGLAIGLVLSFLCVTSPVKAAPLSIEYLTTDLIDVVAGEDLWRYSYFVRGHDFLADQGFSVYFDGPPYRNLHYPAPPPNGDWDVMTIQLDSTLDSPGAYDALALIDNASLADPFTVDFVWHGPFGTQPGSQPFDVYSLDQSEDLTVLESGFTTPAAVPEPGTLLMLATGGLALASGFRRRSRSR